MESRRSTTLTAPRLGNWRKLEITYLAPEGSVVKKGEVVARFDSQPFEDAYRSAYNRLGIARADANKKQAERKAQQFILEADPRSAVAAAAVTRLQLAKLEFLAPKLREIKRLELKRDQLRSEKISKRIASNAAIQQEERTRTEILIKQAKRKFEAAEEAIRGLSVRAPIDGIVIYDRGWHAGKPREGSTKYPGEAVVGIPDLSVMQVRLQVSEIQSRRLKEGQQANVVVSSLTTQPVMGNVARVAKRAAPLKTGSDVKRVEVIVELASVRAGYTAGLSARVRIFVTKRIEGLVAPLDCIFERDSLHVVYMRDGRRFMARRVQVTARNSDFAVIEGDLMAGTELALQRPPD